MAVNVTVSGGTYVQTVIDDTLTISGAAADAKATGDALALKADKSDVVNITVDGQAADADGQIFLSGDEIPITDGSETMVMTEVNSAKTTAEAASTAVEELSNTVETLNDTVTELGTTVASLDTTVSAHTDKLSSLESDVNGAADAASYSSSDSIKFSISTMPFAYGYMQTASKALLMVPTPQVINATTATIDSTSLSTTVLRIYCSSATASQNVTVTSSTCDFTIVNGQLFLTITADLGSASNAVFACVTNTALTVNVR